MPIRSTTSASSPPPIADGLGTRIRRCEGAGVAVTRPSGTSHQISGIDVSAEQGNLDWRRIYAGGARFAYVKASEGMACANPLFPQQYDGADAAGMVRGAYHCARPDLSDGGSQADYFVANGGGWSADGATLPGALALEYGPDGAESYGLTPIDMVTWILTFSDRYYSHTGRFPVIYTSLGWWSRNLGNSGAFAFANPLWIARWNPRIDKLPSGWSDYTFWQYAISGTLPCDQNLFNGDYAQLQAFASDGGL